jgi:hypothetical protein
MSAFASAWKRLGLLACLCAVPGTVYGVSFTAQGNEYPIVGALAGDQVFPQLAMNTYGGYLVWQDNATDGDGYGISARRVNRSLSGSLGVFRVNLNGAGDQTLPQVALLNNGGAVFAWQSSVGANTLAYARFLNPDGTFATGDVPVSTFATDQQLTPVVASLPDGNALVLWASNGQDGNMLGVFGQRFSPTGARIGTEFQVNQTTQFNQRNPAVSVLPNGNFLVAWVSESYSGIAQSVDQTGRSLDPTAGAQLYNIDVYGRLFTPSGTAVTGEFKVNGSALMCANPSISAAADGVVVVWSGKPNKITAVTQITDGWDIFGRSLTIDGQPQGSDFKINSYTYGDQFMPKATALNGLHFVLWTSMEQDGSREGVVARMMTSSGALVSREFRVNTTTISQQMHPLISSDGGQNFLAVWTSFTGINTSFDLFAQRYAIADTLGPPSPPYVSALSQSKLSVTWPELTGYTGVHYQVYMDDATTPVAVDGISYAATNLTAGTTHTFRLAFNLDDGRQSAVSDPATGRTWGEDANFDGLPDDWEALYFGPDPSKWPPASADSDGDGATNLQEFLAGTDPTNAKSVLQTSISTSPQGWRLEWNTQPGLIYQVQSTADGKTWTDLGTARFAAGSSDSLPVAADSNVALFRIVRVR